MADVLTFTPAAISRAIRFFGGPHTSLDVRAAARQPQAVTVSLTLSGTPAFGGTASLAKVGGAAWLTVPATCTDGTPFDVTIDGADLAAGDYAETIRASKAGYDDQDCAVTVAIRPMG